MSAEHSYEGVVSGGPYDGMTIVNNASKGFVLVDLKNNRVWVHDFVRKLFGRDKFMARRVDSLDPERLEQAQEDGGRSVLVLEGSDE